jgi:uncharacterized delta-60 repeat protein
MKNPTDVEGIQGRFIIPAAAIAAGLASQAAVSAPGDLDPTFGSVGRATLPEFLEGSIWALEASVEGEYTYAGGEQEYCDYYYDSCNAGFTGSVTDAGLPNPGFATTVLDSIEVRDVVRQPDRKQVVVGRTRESPFRLIAYRLMPDGSKDGTFGTDGAFVLSGPYDVAGKSVEIDAEGRIVIAGIENSRLIVLRLNPNGSLDESFGEAGVFRGVYAPSIYVAAELAKSPDGGYRLLTSNITGCLVTAITGSGALDGRFGQLGTAVVGSGSESESSCRAIAVQSDGRVIVGGVERAGALVARLRADGTADPTFVGTSVQGQLAQVFSLALAADGSIVAGVSDKEPSPGALLVRLRPDGSLDPGFGIAGRSRIDVETATASSAEASVVRVLKNGGVLVGGSSYQAYSSFGRKPFVARLLAAGAGPGVLGFKAPVTQVDEKDQRAVVVVRRTGGVAGAVSVAYETVAGYAQAGVDYTPVSGRLDWADGDSGERSITVPIVSGDTGAEPEERFSVVLKSAQGGAGIGRSAADVSIRGDGYPAGVLTIVEGSTRVVEPAIQGSYTTLQLIVRRENYYAGPVSVTVSAQSGSATSGDDFQLTPVKLTWGNGEAATQTVSVSVLSDKVREGDETFSIVMSEPTGGAVLGKSSVTATITDTRPAGSGSGGGGSTGVLTLLALGFARLIRTRRA